jgi:ribosomal protein L40E
MAQCYQCGSSVDPSDRFCMGCGAEHPAGSVPAPGMGQPAAPVAAPTPVPRNATSPAPTAPTWLPVEAAPAPWPQANAPALDVANDPLQTIRAEQEAESILCPRCSARLPRGARFCGDCGTRLASDSTALPAPATERSARPASAALPDPIPPFTPGSPSRLIAKPAQPVLPPFRAPGWATQPAPDVEVPDTTWTPPASGQIAPAPANAAPWDQNAPAGAMPPARPPEPAAGSAPQPFPWVPGQPQGPDSARSFQPPFAQPQASEDAGRPQAPSFQARAAVPPTAASRRRRPYPRGQVITLIIASIVTVGSAIAGLLIQLLPHK